MSTGRAFGQLPVEAKQVLEEVVAPLRWCLRPSYFEPAANRIATFAGPEFAEPAETLRCDIRGLWLRTHQGHIARAVGLAEAVPARDQCHRLFIVHRHATECLADIPRRGDGIWIAIRPFRVHIDQTHLHRSERILQIAVPTVSLFREPLAFGTPEDTLLRGPSIGATATKPVGLETHRFERNISRKNNEIGPRYFLAVLLFDRPKQAASLVEIDIVRPAIKGCESLLPCAGATAPVANAVRPGAVPRHADKEWSIMAEIRRPPLLGVRHQRV